MDADETIRFHFDENVDVAIARALRAHGVDVTTAGEVGLLGASDREQLEFAFEHGRVIYTQDSDFLEMHDTGTSHCGIAYCTAGSLSIGEQVHWLMLITSCLSADEIANQVEYLKRDPLD